MVLTEKNIFIQETEVKPNKYASLVLTATLIGICVCWIMNEVGLFRVDKVVMRIGSLIPLIFVSIPLIIIKTKPALLANPKTKYFILICATIMCFTTTSLMTFHTSMLLLYPIFIAMLYRSKSLGRLAVIASVSCTILSPIIGYLLGVWDVPLFQELILIATGGTAEIVNIAPKNEFVNIVKILLYYSFPRLVFVTSCSLLLFYIIRLGNENVDKQIQISRLSHRDALTGLYNQNYFKEVAYSKEITGPVGVIFFDVNGLKKANDDNGHEYGDLLLKRCAKSITDIVSEGKDFPFRVGGDEFAIIVENPDEEYIKDKIVKWRESIRKVNEENNEKYDGLFCSMACGYSIGDAKDINDIINDADASMYRNKQKYKQMLNSATIN